MATSARKPQTKAVDKPLILPTGAEFEGAVDLAIHARIEEKPQPRAEMMKLLKLSNSGAGHRRFDSIVGSKDFQLAMYYRNMELAFTAVPATYSAWACFDEAGRQLAGMLLYKITQQRLGLLPPSEGLTLTDLVKYAPKVFALIEDAQEAMARLAASTTGEDSQIDKMVEKARDTFESKEDQIRFLEALSKQMAEIPKQLMPVPEEDTPSPEDILESTT